MPDAASLDRTTAVAERVDAMLAKIPGVERRSMVSGYSLLDNGFKTNAATFFITFRDFKERYATLKTAKAENARAILTTLYREVQAIEGATVFPAPPPPIPGIGTTGGFEFWVQDTTAGEPARLDDLTQEVIRKAAERPELAGLHTTFRSTTPQLRADVDRDKATLLGVPIEDVYSAIQAQFGSIAVSQFNQFSQVWWVILQSDAKYRQTPEDLTRLYTRTNKGCRRRTGPSARPRTRRRARPGWCRSRRSSPRAGSPAPTCCRTSTASRRRRSTATPRPATARARRSPRWRTSPARCCRRATRSPGRGSRSRRRSRAGRR